MSVLAFVLVACCVCKGMCIHISHIIIIKLPLNFFREHIFVYILLLVWESYRDFEVLIHVWCINVVVILIPLYLGSIQNSVFQKPQCQPSDLTSSYALIRTVMHQLYDGLHDVILELLKMAEAWEKVLQCLADVIQKNANQVQIQVFPYSDFCQVWTPLFSFLGWKGNC
jgi:hypothetical protein